MGGGGVRKGVSKGDEWGFVLASPNDFFGIATQANVCFKLLCIPLKDPKSGVLFLR